MQHPPWHSHPGSLTAVKASGSTSAFSGWFYGKQDPLNLLGTIKSLDELGVETLNCTMNNASHVSVASKLRRSCANVQEDMDIVAHGLDRLDLTCTRMQMRSRAHTRCTHELVHVLNTQMCARLYSHYFATTDANALHSTRLSAQRHNTP